MTSQTPQTESLILPLPPHSTTTHAHTHTHTPLTLLSLLTTHEPTARCIYTHLRSTDLYSLSLTSTSFHSLLTSSIGPWRNLDISDIRCLQLPTRNIDLIPTSLRNLLPGWIVNFNIPNFLSQRVDLELLTSFVADGTGVDRECLVLIVRGARGLRHLSVRWCMGISLKTVEECLDVVERGNGDGRRGLKSFWIFGISAIPAFRLAASADELESTLSRFAKDNISTDVFLCPTCSTDGFISIAICDDNEASCHSCKTSIRPPISCLLCFRKCSCEHCGRFYCEVCRDEAYVARAKFRRSTPSLVEERGEGMEKVVLGQDTLIDAICTSNNYTKYHPWFTLPHRLCPDCICYYGRCQKHNCGKLFCPLTKLAVSIRERNNNNNTLIEDVGVTESTTTDPRYTRKKSCRGIKTEKHFERTDAVSCSVCKRRCCKSCWTEEKYCRVCTTPGKTMIFKNRAVGGMGRKAFCNGCGTFGRACICPSYVCYKCRDEQLEKDGTKWSWFRCQNCRWEGDESHGKEGLQAGSVPAIFGNVGR